MPEAIQAGLSLVVQIADLILFLLLVSAVFRLFDISRTLTEILKKLNDVTVLQNKADRRRREEFNALSGAEGEEK